VIGTAGTVNALVRLLLAREGLLVEPDAPSLQRIPFDAIHDLAERLLGMPLDERLAMDGLDAARADTLGLGAVVVDEVLAGLDVGEIRTCRAAVREGMILDYVATHPQKPARRSTHDVRERSVRDALARYGDATEHGEQVSRLALSLFDGLRSLHGLGVQERELLHYASLLHDIGDHVEHRRHHKHTHYLVKNAELSGFDPREIELLAVVGRYHRRGAPKDDHEEWAAIPSRERPTARALIGLLRVANGLDRGHASTVSTLSVVVRKAAVLVRVAGKDSVDLDVWGARNLVDVLEECLGRRVEVEAVPRGRRRRK
jgi:exopolyphosphatase / guanosine-5'-triphosphate,3'-diphosphate pyrophosphatase